MPRKPISFELDFMTKDILPRFTVKQFDDVSLNITPLMNNVPYAITNMSCVIYIGCDNDLFQQNTDIVVSSNSINIKLNKAMLQNYGRAYAELELKDSNGTVTSSTFLFNIEKKIGEGATIPGSIEGFVAKYERLIAEFKSQVNTTINNCNTNVDNKLNTVDSLINVKISDFEKRFNRLTSSQQQDAEVIDARTDFKGVVFDSLKERIDYTDRLLRDSTVSTVETESDFTTVEATSNGYFEDVKLEGKTLVNLWGNKSSDFRYSGQTSFNSSTQCIEYTSTTNRFSNCFTKNNTQYKPDTKYTIIVNVFENTFTSTTGILKVNSDPGSGSDLGVSRETINIQGGFVGVKIFTLTTLSDLSNSNIAIRTYVDNVNSEVGVKLKFQMIILEGDHTQNPPSYFEGLKSVGQSAMASDGGEDEIVVSSVKGDGNLFDGRLDAVTILTDGNNLGKLVEHDSVNSEYTSHIKPIPIQPNTTYEVGIDNSDLQALCMLYDNNMNPLCFEYSANGIKQFTTPNNAKYARVRYQIKYSDINNYNMYLVKIGDTSKDYMLHQSDKKRLLYYNEETQTWEKPILREWDSIEKHSNGKYYYHQRSAEVVLNGSESWSLSDTSLTDPNNTNSTISFQMIFNDILYNRVIDIKIICDKFGNDVASSASTLSEDREWIRPYSSTSGAIGIKILKTKLSTQDVAGFKQWLQANHVTIVYQLAQEKVYECTNIDLITYNGETNYVIESGVIVPKTTLKVHNNISNVVNLLQKKVSLLESNMTKYMITQNRLMLASRYNADSVSFKVDVATLRNSFEYDNDLYELILNNILVGKDNYDREYIENLIIFYWMDFVISDEMYFTLFEKIGRAHV